MRYNQLSNRLDSSVNMWIIILNQQMDEGLNESNMLAYHVYIFTTVFITDWTNYANESSSADQSTKSFYWRYSQDFDHTVAGVTVN
jgi:hypothetical protein